MNDLPTELWLSEVVPKVDPIGVLSLSQTCRNFQSILSQKLVWADILRSICRTHGLFLASYPTDHMSLSELQRASTGPQRWESLVRRKAVPSRELDSAPPLPVLASAPVGDSTLASLHSGRGHIVPGGRFFIALLGNLYDKSTCLELWDLGVPMRRNNAAPTKLAHRVLGPSLARGWGRGDLFVTVSGEVPDELRVGVLSSPNTRTLTLTVFSIVPTEWSPSFKLLASGGFPGEQSIGKAFIHGNFFVLRNVHQRSLVLWDYVKGQITKIAFPYSAPNRESCMDEVMLTEGHVLHLGYPNVSMWSLPRLRDLGEPISSTLTPDSNIKTHFGVPPDSTYPYPNRITTDGAVVNIDAVRCTIGSPPSVTFDITVWMSKRTLLYRYTLSGLHTQNDTSFRLQLVGKGSLPFNIGRDMSLFGGTMKNNGTNPPFIIERRHTGPQSQLAFIYAPSRTVSDAGFPNGSGGNPRNSSSTNDPEGITATLLEPSQPLASCWASGRFIFSPPDLVMGTDPLSLVDYL